MEQLDFNLSRQARAEKIASDVRARINNDNNQSTATPDSGGGLFGAVLDTVNPLQHIPGVSSIYRGVTNDEINPMASMAGGFLFGGPLGFAAGAASSFIEILTGKSPAEHAMALFDSINDEEQTQSTSVADAHSKGGIMPKGTDPIVEKTIAQAPIAANVFVAANSQHYSGIGADKSTVEYASNIWTQAAINDATNKYDSAVRNNKSDERAQQTLSRSV